jgi:hypothetical protein
MHKYSECPHCSLKPLGGQKQKSKKKAIKTTVKNDAPSSLYNLDLLSTPRVYSGLLHAFIADRHTPLYLIKSITHVRVAKNNAVAAICLRRPAFTKKYRVEQEGDAHQTGSPYFFYQREYRF